MTNLTPTCFEFGMPINLHSTEVQNKLGGSISKNVAKIATNWLKISRAATFCHLWVAITWSFFIRF